MKTYSQYITENLSSDLKKAVKKNGFVIPASFKYNDYSNCFHYSSSKGFRGENVVRSVMTKLKEAGWTMLDNYTDFTPDGSTVEYNNALVSPDHIVLYKCNCSYGGTSYNNYYSAAFVLVADEEEKLTQANVKSALMNFIKGIGLSTYSFPGSIQKNEKGQYICYYGHYSDTSKIETKILDDLRNALKSWKPVGEDAWENNSFRVEIQDDHDYPHLKGWKEIMITVLKNPKTIKI